MPPRQFPGLYDGANEASLRAQRIYIGLQRFYLGSLILGGMLGSLTPVFAGPMARPFQTVLASVLGIGLLILWITRARRDDKAWFDCRAIAESVKTATWRYMMHVSSETERDTADKNFVDELREIREARPGCEALIAAHFKENSPIISDDMRIVRSLAFKERVRIYVTERLTDQKHWYASKARSNSLWASRWFWVAAILQLIAVILAMVQASSGPMAINVIPLLMTIVATVAAWSQTKRHDELSKSYGLASQELTELEAIANAIGNESDFPQLVEQVEEAISREHTLWCARRDVKIGRNRTSQR